MFSAGHVQLSYRVIKARYLKSISILKEIKLLQQVMTKHAECGTPKPEPKFRFSKAIQMKSSRALSIMRAIL